MLKRKINQKLKDKYKHLFTPPPRQGAFDEEDILKQEQNFIDYYTSSEKKGSLGTLLKLYKNRVREIVLACFFYIVKTLPQWVIPITTANIINAATAGGEAALRRIIINVAVVLVLVFQNVFTTYLHTKYLSLANRSVEAGLRGAIVRKLQQLSLSFSKEMESGRIQSKIMRDVEAVEGLASQVFVSLLGITLNIVITVSVTITKSLLVFGFFVVSTVAAVIIMQLFRKKISNSNHEFRVASEKASADVMDMVELIPVTKAHAVEDSEIKKMTHKMSRIAEKGHKVDTVNGLFGASTWVVFTAFQTICLAVTALLAFYKKISVGDIVLYQSYFSTIVGSVSGLIGLLPTLNRGLESVSSIGEILAAHNIEENEGKKQLDSVNGEFEFKEVYFSYDEDTHVINGLDLKVRAGETIALVGGSGAGKSTVLNMIIGFMLPDKGSVLLDGTDMREIDLKSYRSHIAVVPQTSILFSGTIRDNITYGLKNVTDEQIRDAVRAACLEELVASLPQGIDTRIGEHGGRLSGGQRQRISIARAIIRDPDVIILDEATSALDTVTEREIQTAIDNLTSTRTTFIVAHRLSTIRNADRIAVLDGGRCVEIGTYEELMKKKGEFYRLKTLQS